MPDVRVPEAVGELQTNFCRNPNCASFGVPARTAPLKRRGVSKGRIVTLEFPPPSAASCMNVECPNHGRTLAAAPEAYAPDRRAWTAWSQRWTCRACRKTFRVAVPDAPPPPDPPSRHQDVYTVQDGELTCHRCGETVTLRSNAAIVEETNRLSAYLQPRPVPSCPDPTCTNHGRSVHDKNAATFYREHGTTRGGSKRFLCKACGTTFSVARSITGQRRSEVNLLLFKLLLARVSLSKIASILEISPPTVYDKIDFLREQCLRFQGDRERTLIGRRFDELRLATDRQAYLCNWVRAQDARNLQINGVATADTDSGYVIGMHVAFDPAPDPAAVEAAAVGAGDYDLAPPYRKHARLWLEGDFGASAEHSAKARAKRKKNAEERAEGADDGFEEIEDEEAILWTRKLPDRGMLVHQDYTLHAHYQLLRKLLDGAEHLCFYTEKETGIRAAIMSAFRDKVLEDKVEAFHVMITKELTVRERRALVSRSKALFRKWLKQRRQEGRITTEDWEKCRAIRLLEAIDAPDLIWDQRLRQAEPWIWHPFANLAEPEKRVLHLTARPPEASSKRNSDAVRPRRPIERERLARLVDKASLHAVDRYFQQIRRELAGLERGIAVASNRRRIWYGYSPYDGSMIQRHLDIHRAYYNFVQVGEDGLTRAQRFGLARGRIRFQDIVYYR